MAPCREDLRDPLEVTRTISSNSITSSLPDSPTSRIGEPLLDGTHSSTATVLFECDYDQNPTVLYQAIEAKQWDYAISLFTDKGNNVDHNNNDDDEEEASATWVVRKEFNGKLRWRLLPLHAAVIFGSPLELVELLLAVHPLAAQCKDDRGMLPLHLAFRNEVSWDIIDELLTAYPLAIFMTDRKGRTPLKCGVSKPLQNANQGIQSVNSMTSSSTAGFHSSVGSTGGASRGVNQHPDSSSLSSFRPAAGVLELYSQIAVSGERKRVEQEARVLAQNGLSQVKDSHYRQLAKLKSEWEKEKLESQRQREKVERENAELKERVKILEHELELRDKFGKNTTKEMSLMNIALNQANERVKANNPSMHKMEGTNKALQIVTESLVKQQKVYHGRVQNLLTKFEEMVTEREKMRSIFINESSYHQQTELTMVESFRNWFEEEGLKLSSFDDATKKIHNPTTKTADKITSVSDKGIQQDRRCQHQQQQQQQMNSSEISRNNGPTKSVMESLKGSA